jgi:hypothetical protein
MLHLWAYAAEFQRQRDDESFVSAYSGYCHEEGAPGDGQLIELRLGPIEGDCWTIYRDFSL